MKGKKPLKRLSKKTKRIAERAILKAGKRRISKKGRPQSIVKSFIGQMPVPKRELPQELPSTYGKDRLVILVRDPRWLYAYWDLKDPFPAERKILRIYDVTNVIFNGRNANRSFDIEVSGYAENWYINIGEPGRRWCVDLGFRLTDARFVSILRSNTVNMPLEGPSWVTDEEWMIPEEMFARLYGMGFGLGQSSPVGKGWQERVKRELFSGEVTSPIPKRRQTDE